MSDILSVMFNHAMTEIDVFDGKIPDPNEHPLTPACVKVQRWPKANIKMVNIIQFRTIIPPSINIILLLLSIKFSIIRYPYVS